MKNALIIIFLIACVNSTFSQTSTNIISHDEVIIVTDPSQGVNSFVEWAEFPGKEKEIRKITMNVTLAYPDDRAIAHWDYMDRIKILRQGGKNGELLDYEIGRMLTPYGSNFKEDWSYTWKVDVTDFQAFLCDSVEIEYIHSGYESPELGWDLTISFDIDFGPAVADFISAQKMWNGGFQYGNPENDIEKHLSPVKIKKEKNTHFGRLRIQQTGHGMDRPSGCSEFCSRWREVIFDEEVVDHRDLWKDCGNNPLYPQGGTWIFDRGYWCPGDLQEPDIIDILLTKRRHTIDLYMEPFTANDVNQPKEQITSVFFQYEAPNHQNDVAVEEIIAPNKVDNYNRFNPAGFTPKVIIRNLGSEDLKKLTIIYRTVGFEEKMFEWNGNLGFYEAAIIALPGIIDASPGLNTFEVVLSEPNGVVDEWDADNSMQSEFNDIPTIPSSFVVDFLTNNKPEDNSVFIVNSQNDTVYSRLPESLEPATQYLDTLALEEDNYYLALKDTAGDGLEFWFQPKSGFGRLRLKDMNENFIHLFESDCGNGQFYGFRADNEAKVDITVSYFSVNIFPRMVEDNLTIYTTTDETSTLKIVVTKDGEYIEQHEYTNIKDAQTGLDARHLEEGRYVMEVFIDGEHRVNRRFNKR